MSTIIFTMTHKAFTPPKDPMFVPLQVGRVLSTDLGYIGDDTGDSISKWNPYFSELTGMYWVWKNFRTDGNVGLCHYRRFFIHENGNVITEQEYDSLLETYDLVTTKQVVLNNSYYDGYAVNHHIKDLIETGNVIREFYPEYHEEFERIVHGNRTYFGNMIVCKKELFDAYSEWLFGILFRVKERIDVEHYDNYRKRVFGFISEILLLVYATHHRLSVCECKVGMPGEKVETREVKERLAEYFLRKDYVGAGAFFKEALAKRPDILMEASDVDGQLMMSLEIITICEQENSARPEVILERMQDFNELMAWVSDLNQLAEANVRGEKSSEEAQRICEQKNISKQAFEVALVVARRKRKLSLAD
ncbi:MAG: DUF4422 domain-containing protein [Lachnospiraceae bacterium]|nr:DUF4422 domain-containing protein [Lachnospiraceae bacterium]